MLLLYEYRTKKKKNHCITYYEPCLKEVFTSAHTVYFFQSRTKCCTYNFFVWANILPSIEFKVKFLAKYYVDYTLRVQTDSCL